VNSLAVSLTELKIKCQTFAYLKSFITKFKDQKKHGKSSFIKMRLSYDFHDSGVHVDELVCSDINFSGSTVDHEFVAATFFGLGVWRLRSVIQAKIAIFVARIEGIIRQCCTDDDLDIGLSGRFEYWDTHDLAGEKIEKDPFFTVHMTDPEKDDPDYPRLQIENRVYISRVFRKIHIEVAARQDGLQLVHLAMFPRTQFCLPILIIDLDLNQNGAYYGFADSTSVQFNRSLPVVYSNTVRQIQSCYNYSFSFHKWGKNIFSPLCINAKLSSVSEVNCFIEYICSFLRLHLEVARFMKSVNFGEQGMIEEIFVCQRHFCEHHHKDKKTSVFLANSFGKIKAAKYIREFMFDLS